MTFQIRGSEARCVLTLAGFVLLLCVVDLILTLVAQPALRRSSFGVARIIRKVTQP